MSIDMTGPRLNVRSAVVCDLARQLSRLEGRSMRAIVEDALDAYAKRYSDESDEAMLARTRSV